MLRKIATQTSSASIDEEQGRPIRKSLLRRTKKRKPSSRRPLLMAIIVFAGIIFCLMVIVLFYLLRDRNKHQTSTKLVTRSNQVELPAAVIDMCTNALWHTIETTTIVLPNGETFIHTGDIDDLWIRDSAAQVHPLLIPRADNNQALIYDDVKLDRIVSGLIKRVAMYIRHDPYANAFRIDDTYVFSEEQKRMGRHDLISTWNYELDSGAFYIRMLYFYWKQSREPNVLHLESVQQAVTMLIELWKAEQQHELDNYPTGLLFDCLNCRKPYRYPGLSRNGKGSPTNSSAGLSWTGFRPSDDACKYHYLIPANMFAVVALGYAAEMASELWNMPALAAKARSLALDINRGLQEHAIVDHPMFGRIYAYEVDGLGNANLMDDANVPSLLSIPYLEYPYDPQIYANTRRFIFSSANPTYHKGANHFTGAIEGYGSPHMEATIRNNIWPMSLAIKGLTTSNIEERRTLAIQLQQASAGTGYMHESFDVNDPSKFTRSWFCWADSLYAELVLSLTDSCPRPTRKYKVMEWRDSALVQGGNFAGSG